VTVYAVLALVSLSVGYLAGVRTSEGGVNLNQGATEEPSSSADDADLAAVKSSIVEDCKMVRLWIRHD